MRKILKIKLKDVTDLIKIIFTFIPGLYLKSKKTIWIVTDRGNQAQDNGYWLFKYILDNNANDGFECYFAITKNSQDYQKMKEIGPILNFGSFKHFMYAWGSTKYISSQFSLGFPGRTMYYLWIYNFYHVNFYFLQHGVTQNKSKYLMEPAKKTRLVCCVSKKERDFFMELGYSSQAAVNTGFCRYDGLTDISKENKIVLIMPTWRNYLSECSEEVFINSDFYKSWMNLINCKALNQYFSEWKFYFCLHPGMAKFSEKFKSANENFIFINNEYTYQQLINMCNILITDYSSIAFDFAYLNKSIIYYQFDKTDFQSKHLQEGYYHYERDGFGPVYNNIVEIIEYLNEFQFQFQPKYYKRKREFFNCCEDNYSKKVFDSIIKN